MNKDRYKRLQAEKNDRLFGKIMNYEKICSICDEVYIFTGRLKTKAYERSIFCSVSCSHNRQEWWNDNAKRYKTVALQHHKHKCVICGFDKVVAIHHIDENRQNNAPSNLIPLCPNHHEMYHSKWKNEILPFIIEWQTNYILNKK